MVIETERLILREMTKEDFSSLHKIFSDAETMKYYPHPFSAEDTLAWIERNVERCCESGFGLWAVELKRSGEVIGDCGVTMQSINGRLLPEIGYHISREHQNRGFATEAAAACKKYAFETLHFKKVYSYMKHSNLPSRRVAEKIGMAFEEEYKDDVNKITAVYAAVCGE